MDPLVVGGFWVMAASIALIGAAVIVLAFDVRRSRKQ